MVGVLVRLTSMIAAAAVALTSATFLVEIVVISSLFPSFPAAFGLSGEKEENIFVLMFQLPQNEFMRRGGGGQ